MLVGYLLYANHFFTALFLTLVCRHCRFCDVWAGTYVSFAKSVSGDIYAWGLNNYYQLGIDDMVNRFVPELVKALPSDQGWQGIAGGQHHTVAVNKDG